MLIKDRLITIYKITLEKCLKNKDILLNYKRYNYSKLTFRLLSQNIVIP